MVRLMDERFEIGGVCFFGVFILLPVCGGLAFRFLPDAWENNFARSIVNQRTVPCFWKTGL